MLFNMMLFIAVVVIGFLALHNLDIFFITFFPPDDE